MIRTAMWRFRRLRCAPVIFVRAQVVMVLLGLAWLGAVVSDLRDLKQIAGVTHSQIEEGRHFPLGVQIIAAPESPIHWSMLHGFGQPEPDGTWIVSIEGALEIKVPAGARWLLFELYPYLPKGVDRRTAAIRTGEEAQLVSLGDGITVVRIPAAANSRQSVTIECDFAVSPFLLGDGPDKRTLCVKLLSVEAIPDK